MAKAAPEEINFKGVSTSGRRIHVPEGDYILRAKSVEATESKSSKNPMWVFKFEFENGPKAGAEIIDRVVLVKQSLFRLRNLLEAVGLRVPEGKMTVDPQKIVQIIKKKGIGAQIVDDDAYEGHIPSTIKRYIPVDEVNDTPEEDDESDEEETDEEWDDDLESLESDEDDEDEDDEEDEDEEEDEEDEEDEDEEIDEEYLESLELADLKALAKEYGVPRKKGKRSSTYIKEILAVVEGDEEDEEDEEEPEPPPKKTTRKKASKKAGSKKSSTVEELEDFDLGDLE